MYARIEWCDGFYTLMVQGFGLRVRCLGRGSADGQVNMDLGTVWFETRFCPVGSVCIGSRWDVPTVGSMGMGVLKSHNVTFTDHRPNVA